MPRGGPCAAERRPRAAGRRPLCRREEALCREGALCAGRYFVLRGLEEALCREEAPVPRGCPLCW